MKKAFSALKQKYWVPEDRRWMRLIDSGIALFCATSSLLTLYIVNIYQTETAQTPSLTNTLAWTSLIGSLITAFLLYRQTDINRVERLGLVLLLLACSMALLMTTF